MSDQKTLHEMAGNLPQYRPGARPPGPPAMASASALERKRQLEGEQVVYFDVGPQSEERVRYLLETKFGADVAKEIKGGKRFTLADYTGSVPIVLNRRLYPYWWLACEVKGISPGKSFSLSGLRQRDNLYRSWLAAKESNTPPPMLIVALVWWDAIPGRQPIKVGNKALWRKRDVYISMVHMVNWSRWIRAEYRLLQRAAGAYKGRSIRRPNRVAERDWDLVALQESEIIPKLGKGYATSRWIMPETHWFQAFKPNYENPNWDTKETDTKQAPPF